MGKTLKKWVQDVLAGAQIYVVSPTRNCALSYITAINVYISTQVYLIFPYSTLTLVFLDKKRYFDLFIHSQIVKREYGVYLERS